MISYEETTIWTLVKNRALYFGPRLVTSISDLSELLIPSYDFSFYSPQCLFFSWSVNDNFTNYQLKVLKKGWWWGHKNNDYVSIFEGYRNPFLRSMEVLKNLFSTVQTQSTFERFRSSMVSSGAMRLTFSFLFATFTILSLLVWFLTFFDCLSIWLFVFWPPLTFWVGPWPTSAPSPCLPKEWRWWRDCSGQKVTSVNN